MQSGSLSFHFPFLAACSSIAARTSTLLRLFHGASLCRLPLRSTYIEGLSFKHLHGLLELVDLGLDLHFAIGEFLRVMREGQICRLLLFRVAVVRMLRV